MKTKLILSAIIAILFIGLASTIVVETKHIKALDNELALAVSNMKAYELENSNLENNIHEFQYTVAQLNYSKDSLVQKMNQMRKDLKIKDKNIERLEYLASQTQKVDSVVIKDTIFVKDVAIDTTLRDDWSKLHLQLSYPNTIVADYSFKNEVFVATSVNRETVNPPSKVFFIRWFQKKHNVVLVDVTEQNPYCEIKEQKFINVVD